jgi:hypothetical protein
MLLAAHPYAGGSSVCLVVQKSENLIPSVCFFWPSTIRFRFRKKKQAWWLGYQLNYISARNSDSSLLCSPEDRNLMRETRQQEC